MKIIPKRFIIFSALASLAVLSACDQSDKESGSQTVGSGEKAVSKTTEPKAKASNVMKAVQALSRCKKKSGYETPAEVKVLSDELMDDTDRLMKIRKEHPTLKKIAEESAESNAKLMQAVADNNEEEKMKWGKIVGEFAMKKQQALAEIPEILALEKEIAKKEAKIEELEYHELAKTPEGKELADKLRAVMASFTGH